MLVSLAGTEGPLARRVYASLRRSIHEGVLGAGERLPSSRRLASDLGVSRTTVLAAYDQLLAEGYASSRRGSGTYVADELPERALRARRAGAPGPSGVAAGPVSAYAGRLAELDLTPPSGAFPDVPFDFSYGAPAVHEFPQEVWLRLFHRGMRSASRGVFLYGAPEGDEVLRAEIASYLARARAVRCRPEQVLIVNGSQQALDLAARLLLDPGDAAVLENPHYQGARHALSAAGAKLVAVPVDESGLDPSRFPPEATEARLAYVTPSHQFPTGVIMSLARRLALLEWAEARGAYVIEDDYDSEYRYEGRPIEALQGLDRAGRVLYVGTFSKVLYPALRIGYLVLPEPLVARFTKAKWLTDRHTPTLEQRALAQFISAGHFERHLRRSRTRNAARRVALLEALDRELAGRVRVQGENAGIHLVAWLREPLSVPFDDALARAREAGVGVQSVAPYYLGDPPGNGLLLGFSHLNPAQIAEGVRRLAQALRA